MASIIDPRLFDQLAPSYYNRIISVWIAQNPNVLGEMSETSFALIVDNIRCYLARYKGLLLEADEKRRNDIEAYDDPRWSCMLDSYHDEIAPNMYARIDGVYYNIRGVVHLGTQTLTKLTLERIY
jgi:hypothetical protein